MKRITLAAFAILLITDIFGARKDTCYRTEGNHLLKVLIISDMEFEGISPKAFSEDEAKILEKGGFVNKVTARGKYLISIFPSVQTMDRMTISIFQQLEPGKVRSTNEIFPISPPEDNYRKPISGMYIPFLFIFLVAYFNSKDKKRISKFIKFSAITTIALMIAIVLGRFNGMMSGGFMGATTVAVAAILIGRLTGVSGGALIFMIFAGFFSGGFVGKLAEMPGVIWRYIPIYITVCVSALMFQEIVAPKKEKPAENEK